MHIVLVDHLLKMKIQKFEETIKTNWINPTSSRYFLWKF